MRVPDLDIERHYARHEFSVPHDLSGSALETLSSPELPALAGVDARARSDGLRLGYTESAGLPALRSEIASLYPGLGPEDILVLAGAQEAFSQSPTWPSGRAPTRWWLV